MLLLLSISQSVNSRVCKAWQWLLRREVNINTKGRIFKKYGCESWSGGNVYAYLRDISSLRGIFQCLSAASLSHLCFFFPSACWYNLSSLHIFLFFFFYCLDYTPPAAKSVTSSLPWYLWQHTFPEASTLKGQFTFVLLPELPSFGDFCLLSNIMGLNGALIVMLHRPCCEQFHAG